MVERNRHESGKKAAITNRKKDDRYYESIGGMGGKIVDAAKRAFSKVPGLASRAAQSKHLVSGQGIEYLVRTTFETKTTRTRADARELKRSFRSRGYKAHIIRKTFDVTGYLIEEKEVW